MSSVRHSLLAGIGARMPPIPNLEGIPMMGHTVFHVFSMVAHLLEEYSLELKLRIKQGSNFIKG